MAHPAEFGKAQMRNEVATGWSWTNEACASGGGRSKPKEGSEKRSIRSEIYERVIRLFFTADQPSRGATQ